MLAIPIAAFVYFALAIITIAQPVSVFGLSLTVPIPGLPPSRIFDLPDRPFTVLIVGLDVRPQQGGPSRTDTLLLLRVDAGGNRAGIVSVPRDALMRVPVPGGGSIVDRVNTAYVYNWSPDVGRSGNRCSLMDTTLLKLAITTEPGLRTGTPG